MIDLGLPSGIKWSCCNVGANTPEEYGDYYAWGETQTKSDYCWKEYYYCNGSELKITKYCNNGGWGNNGYTDDKITLDSEDDIAHVHEDWGGGWRMPTQAEMEELLENCTKTATKQNGVKGYKLTSNINGYTDRSIFLPAAGYRSYTSTVRAGSYGYYWSSSLDNGHYEYGVYTSGDPRNAFKLYFYSNSDVSISERYYGYPVRPVCQ